MPEHALPVVAVLATGGTIAGAQADATSAGYKAGSFSVNDLLAAVPQLAGIADIRAEQVANVGSQNMTHEVWRALAERVETLCQDASVAGIVITHGTDTLEETAYFLSLVIPHDKPVVLVGAMRPATALGAEGPANLYNAVALARHPDARGRGPLVVMNEDVHYAREIQKIASAGLCAFASPNRGRAGVMHGGVPCFYSRNTTTHTTQSEFSLALLQQAGWPRVDIVYAHANLQADLIDFLAGLADGIVLAGVGDGNATDLGVDALSRAVAGGTAVVRASRTGSGFVARDVELDDASLGFIAAGDLNPQKSRILLMLGLSVTRDTAALQAIFDRY
ncbi:MULTISPECIES: asparaginase [Achromobacter]|jgi:L-asparaginase|uniref:asparaginase n=1 Tax=Achromobacter TaxID=222 RepID=UPI000CFC7813|nr:MULTISPECIES: asparaginase [Achromobacter]MDR6604693.1 L-asparaginase [Achromobacter deleyi]PQZ70871.1 L-asparaginase [Achromobacter sp. MYb9]HCW19157.1 asparaginase [Achromobacter sp.]